MANDSLFTKRAAGAVAGAAGLVLAIGGLVKLPSLLDSGKSSATGDAILNSVLGGHLPERRLERQGELQFGRVLWIKDVHYVPNSARHELEETGRYQLAVCHELERSKIKTLFVEGLTYNLVAGQSGRTEKLSVPADLLKYCSGPMPVELSPVELERLGEFGAAFLYASRHQDVSLLQTTTSEAELGFADRKAKHPELADQIVFAEREKLAVEFLSQYLMQNPKASVGLQFGCQHQGLVGRINGPEVSSVYWPSVYAGFAFNVSERLHVDENPLRRLRVIKEATYLPLDVFNSLKSEREQMLALPKLRTNWQYWEGGASEALQFLKNAAKSESVVQELSQLEKQFSVSTCWELEGSPTLLQSFGPYTQSLQIAFYSEATSQERLLPRCGGFFDSMFGELKSEKAQVLALDKLIATNPNEKPSESKRRLKSVALTDIVRKKIEQKYGF